MIIIIALIIAIIVAVILTRINRKNNRKPIGKLKITALIIVLWLILGGISSLIFPKKYQNEVHNTTTNNITSTPAINNKQSIKSIPLGTQATTKTGKIYVNMEKSFKGIKGMNKPELLLVLPSLNGNDTDIGSHGVAYYNSDLTKESLADFYSEVVTKSKCDYITLVNINDTSTGIVITSSGTFSKGSLTKGSLTKGSDYELNKTFEMGLLNNTNKIVKWKKV